MFRVDLSRVCTTLRENGPARRRGIAESDREAARVD